MNTVQLRLIGAPEQVAWVLEQLSLAGAEVAASAMYPSRYSTGHIRLYAEVAPITDELETKP